MGDTHEISTADGSCTVGTHLQKFDDNRDIAEDDVQTFDEDALQRGAAVSW